MSSYTAQEAEAILKPLFTVYLQAIDDQKWDQVEGFYHKNAVLINRDGENKDFFGNKAIATLFKGASDATGKTTNSFTNAKFQGAVDYLIINANYKTETEKAGVITGEFLQIWKKTGENWSIYHDEFTVDK